MSRLSDLLRAASQLDPQLAKDLEEEIQPLQKRLRFGLNFERHAPEAVELAGHKIRKGSKVRVLPPRGDTSRGDRRLWRVESLDSGQASIVAPNGDEVETATVALSDLILVAEFRDRIYPGLRPDGDIRHGGDKPFQTVINGENFHVLEQLTFTHHHAVDVVYIDPPYNSRDKDWKYNNDYVDGDDLYRHSKWLAFMERRLRLAKRLLKPDSSVLVVTIDEHEYLRLGLLLEQTFPEAVVQMVTAVIAPQGSARGRFFKRSEEYVYCVYFGDAAVLPLPLGAEWGGTSTSTVRGSIHWASLKRTGTGARRVDREGMFYPVYLDAEAKHFVSVGQPLGAGVPRTAAQVPDGCVAVWPLRRDGSEGRWQVGPSSLQALIDSGFAKLGLPKGEDTAISYLKAGEQKKVGKDYEVIGRAEDGSIITETGDAAEASFRPSTVWNLSRHSAGHHGSNLLRSLIPGRSFPFPKSLYAVEDVLRFFVADKPNAVVLDFFSGSGTTAHAIMRLNKQDDGSRQCICVTNNEVSADEQSKLKAAGFRPGDPEWEKWGICDYITKPRIRAAITGKTPEGDPINGDYKFVDEFSMADGFEENAAFFTLTYESPFMVTNDRAFSAISPMLWLRAGARGERIDSIEGGWAVVEAYGILRDLDQTAEFLEAVNGRDHTRIAYVVTDDEGRYQQVVRELRDGIEPVRLYEDYLRNCESLGDL